MTQNLCCNGLVISADIVIPESQDPHPNFIQPIGPPLVVGDGVGIRVHSLGEEKVTELQLRP
jgi:hypothetical protein